MIKIIFLSQITMVIIIQIVTNVSKILIKITKVKIHKILNSIRIKGKIRNKIFKKNSFNRIKIKFARIKKMIIFKKKKT